VLGVHGPDGPVAFDAAAANQALVAGRGIESGRVRVVGDAGGLTAVDAETDAPLASSTVDWWAWSRAYPAGVLWVG